MPDTATDRAVEDGIERLKVTYPPQRWSDGMLREYRRVLLAIDRPDLIEQTIDRAIDENEARFAPPPGAIVSIGAELVRIARAREAGVVVLPPETTVDEAALIDALEARRMLLDPNSRWDLFTLEEIDEQIARIRRRIDDEQC